MSQIRPQIALRYGRQNQPVRVPLENMVVDPPAQSYFSQDATAGASTLFVQNQSGFAINQILLLGDIGNQNSEIVYTSTSTAPSVNEITLNGTTAFPHSASTPITVLYYDQIQLYTAPTTTGTKTPLGSLINIVANQATTDYNDLAGSTGFYFARWHNSVLSTYSDYSEPSPVTAYGLFSARTIIDKALNSINKKTSEILSDEYGFQMIDDCQMECLREFKRWSFMQSFDTIVGTTQTGTWKQQLPANMDDQVTYKSLWNFRIGREEDMVWVAKDEWDSLIQGIAYSTLSIQANISDTTLTLISSNDFDQQGTVQVGPNQYTWTANNTATGVLTLGSPVIAIAPVGQDVFQYADLGYPTYWTIWGGYIYHWPICSSVYSGRNYYMDYYIAQLPTTTDYQNILLPDSTVVEYYLQWKFLLKLNNGEDTPASEVAYNNYVTRRTTMKQKESTNRNFIFNTDVSGYGSYNGDY